MAINIGMVPPGQLATLSNAIITQVRLYDLRGENNTLSNAIVFPLTKSTSFEMKKAILQYMNQNYDGNCNDPFVHLREHEQFGPVEAVIYGKGIEDSNEIVRLRYIESINVSLEQTPFVMYNIWQPLSELLQGKITWIKVNKNMKTTNFKTLLAKLFKCEVHIYVHQQILCDNETIEHTINQTDTVDVMTRGLVLAKCVMRESYNLSHQIAIPCSNTTLVRDLKEYIRGKIASFCHIGEDMDLFLIVNNVLLRQEDIVGLKIGIGNLFTLNIYVSFPDSILINVTYKQTGLDTTEIMPLPRNSSTQELREFLSPYVYLPAEAMKLILNNKKLLDTDCISKERTDFQEGADITVLPADPIKLKITAHSSAECRSFDPQSFYMPALKLETLNRIKSLIRNRLIPRRQASVALQMKGQYLTDINLKCYRLNDGGELHATIYEDAILVYVYFCKYCAFYVVIRNPKTTTVHDLLIHFSEILKTSDRDLYMFSQWSMSAMDRLMDMSIRNGSVLILRLHKLTESSQRSVSIIYQCRVDGPHTFFIPREAVRLNDRFRLLEIEVESCEPESLTKRQCPVVNDIDDGFILCNEMVEIFKSNDHNIYTARKQSEQSPRQWTVFEQTMTEYIPNTWDDPVILEAHKRKEKENVIKTPSLDGTQELERHWSKVSSLACNDVISTNDEGGRSASAISEPPKQIFSSCTTKHVYKEDDKLHIHETTNKTVSEDYVDRVDSLSVSDISEHPSLQSLGSVGRCSDIAQSVVDSVARQVSDKWKDLARQLDFKEEEITSIQHDCSNQHFSLEEYARKVLSQWMNKNGKYATRQQLGSALEKASLRRIAEEANLPIDDE